MTTVGVALLLFGLVSDVGARSPGSERLATAPSRFHLEELVRRISFEHGVDPDLAHAVVRVESDYDPRAVSRRGALGLMQLMPATAQRLDVDDPFDPEKNVRAGVREVARLLDRFAGNLPLVLAAYNAGEGAVLRFQGIPPYDETQHYVTRVMSLYTGRPYRLPSIRISPVRMERSSGGGVVITNLPRGTTGHDLSRLHGGSGSTLAGGFGTR
jgi:soluble lytic murein transglycosylase-like protein